MPVAIQLDDSRLAATPSVLCRMESLCPSGSQNLGSIPARPRPRPMLWVAVPPNFRGRQRIWAYVLTQKACTEIAKRSPVLGFCGILPVRNGTNKDIIAGFREPVDPRTYLATASASRCRTVDALNVASCRVSLLSCNNWWASCSRHPRTLHMVPHACKEDNWWAWHLRHLIGCCIPDS